MASLIVAATFFVTTFSVSIFCMYCIAKLRRKPLGGDTVRSMTMTVGIVATLTAVVLGLLINSTKESFDHTERAIKHSAIQILTLHRLLKKYETEQARVIDLSLLSIVKDSLSSNGYKNQTEEQISQSIIFSKLEDLVDQIRSLQPTDAYHRVLFEQMIRLTDDLLQSRWFAVTSIGSSIPDFFLIVLWFWLVITFGCFGLMSPLNKHTVIIKALCSLSVSSAIFLMLELDGAFDGLIYASLEPLHVTYRLLQE